MTFDDTLAGSAPPPAAFTVTVDGLRWRVESATLAGRSVALRLGLGVNAGEAVALAYDAGYEPVARRRGTILGRLPHERVEHNAGRASSACRAGVLAGHPEAVVRGQPRHSRSVGRAVGPEDGPVLAPVDRSLARTRHSRRLR